MLKPIKLLLQFFSLLLISVVIVIIGVVIVIDPNAYKADLERVVHQHCGRELKINGTIKWSLTPQITLSVQDVTLNNSSNFTGPMLKTTEANIKLSLIELLKKKIVIKGLILKSPKIYLIKAKNGQINFDDFLTPKKQKIVASQDTQIKLQEEKKTQESFPAITIDELNIKNGTVQWQDLTSNKTIIINNLNIISKNLKLDFTKELAPIVISGNIKDLSDHFKEITFATTITANVATKTFKIAPLQINLSKTNIVGDFLIKIINKVINIDPINIMVLDSKHQASIMIDLREAVPVISIKNITNTFEIEKILTELVNFKKLHGNTKFTTALQAKGDQLMTLKNSLQGTIDITMQQGTFDGIDIHKLLTQAETTLHGLFNIAKDQQYINIPSLVFSQVQDWKVNQGTNAKTNFDTLHAIATFQNGISRNTNFILQHNDYDVKGHGEINLITETINMQIIAIYKSVNQGENADVADYMLQTPITILVKGHLYNPTVKPDLHTYCKDALGKIQKEVLKNTINKTINKIINNNAPNNTNEQNDPLKSLEKNLLDNLLKMGNE